MRVTLNPLTGILVRQVTDTHREEGHAKMEAAIGVMQLQAKEHQELPPPSRIQEESRKDSPMQP